ncbi:MAG: 2-oxoglutarate dehydrogenase E1 component, partial [Gemmatimonadetes bacterium]|nr:2-oxoglutarate dehydrogenase E1 component [Gemmatimonadota bacterium]
SDVVVDLIGFRRYGHSEVDDPSITHPALYKKIEAHPPLYESYAEKIGADAGKTAQRYRSALEEAAKKVEEVEKKPALYTLPDYWSAYKGGGYRASYEVDTGVAAEELRAVAEKLSAVP